MATFNLSNTNGIAVTRLQPWTINSVVFKGVEEKSGTAKDGNTWKAIQFKFSGDKGIFEPMFFCPKEGGDQRLTGETAGRKWELPSQIEQLACTIAHVVGTLAPTNYAKLQNVSLDLPKDFDKLVEIVKKALAPAVNKAINIKLVGDNKGYATVPNFINVKDGSVHIYNNWLGENLAFSSSEIKKMEKIKNTKPTEIEKDITPDDDSDDDGLDLDNI